MKFFSEFAKKDILSLSVVLFLSILAARSLIFNSGYFNMHDDLQMMRQLEMEKCFKDLQIPCRWAPDMGYGYGFPLFNFYPPLPYLIGEIIRLLGLSFVTTVKLTFALSFILSGVTMYLLAKEFFGRVGGVVSSIFYLWAPYHAVDVYVRGAMNEAWALIWFPLILWTSYKLIVEKKRVTKWVVALSLSWVGLLTSHNLMVLIFAPVFVVWCLLFLWREKRWKVVPQLLISGILAFGFSAFFTLPALLEQKHVQVNTLVVGYYEYIAHFANLNQLLFSRFWGYGPSVWGDNDGMSFQIGHIHWVVSLVVGSLIIYKLSKEKKFTYPLLTTIFFILIGWFSAFMAHSRSTPIWQAFPALAFVQFPWRFLAIVILAFSFVACAVLSFLPKKLVYWLTSVLVAGLVILNWNYFKPERIGPLTDREKFSGAAWELQQTAGIYDYLPKSAKFAPKGPRTIPVEYLNGSGEVFSVSEGTNWVRFKVDGIGGVVRINIFDFPNWKVFVDGKETTVFTNEDDLGRIHFTLPPGEHEVYTKLYDTWPRVLGNLTSLVSWGGLFAFVIKKRRK